MRFVIEIEYDTDNSLKTAREFKVYAQAEDAHQLFRHLHFLYQTVKPVGSTESLAVVGGKFYETQADDDASAIEEVKNGRAQLINDVAYADIPILENILPD